jgi:murein DD-endopeptidase MepM/ murein hydrolase activator NlpD
MDDDALLLIGGTVTVGAAALWLAHRFTPQPGGPSPLPARDRSATAPTTTQISTSATVGHTDEAPVHEDAGALWLWPIAIADGHRPVVSDGFGSPRSAARDGRHAGVDLMFARSRPTDHATTERPNTPAGSPGYFVPAGTLALAASTGRVWSAQRTSRGHQVLIDHGRFATLYQHLERLLINERHGGGGGPIVEAGHPLGVVGGDPTNPPHLRHLHFEVWIGRTQIDPEPFLRRWQLLEIRETGAQVVIELRGPARTTREPALWRG